MLIKIGGYPITAGFGSIDAVHKIPHKGVDLGMPSGTELHAIADGVVSRIADFGPRSSGKTIWIKLQDGTEVMYGHLSDIKVHLHEYVHAGDVVALSGSTGFSTGPHLHLQVTNSGTLLDPMTQPESHGWIYNLFHKPMEISGDMAGKAADHAADATLSYIGHFLYRLNLDFVSILPEFSVTLICLLMAIGMITATTGKMLARSAGIYLGGAAWIILTKTFV